MRKLVVVENNTNSNGTLNSLLLETTFSDDFLQGKHFLYGNIVYVIQYVRVGDAPKCFERIKTTGERYWMIIRVKPSRFPLFYKYRLNSLLNNTFCVSDKAIRRLFK